MEYGDWYERYQNENGQRQTQKNGRSGQTRRSIGAFGLIVCMLVAAVLGGGVGGYITKNAMEAQLTDATAALNAAASALADHSVPSESAAKPVTSSQQTEESTLPMGATAGFSKAQIIELCAPSVVGIDVTYQSAGYSYWGQQYAQESTGSGSGIIITSDGYVVTCMHVVEGASSIKVVLNDDTVHEATLVGCDERTDLAVIKMEGSGFTPCTLGDSDTLTVGDEVIAIGNPLGELRGTATSGIISALNRRVNVENLSMSLLQTDAAISPGNSGGGLFNDSGTLVGIVNAKASSSNAEGLGFAIPVSSVREIISDLMDLGYVRGRAYLGVYTQNVTLQSGVSGWGGSSYFGSHFGSGSTYCVKVEQVVSGSAADAAGIQPGDLILAVGDVTVSDGDSLSSAIGAYNAGDTATLTIQRDGAKQDVTVIFGEYSPQA